MSEPPSHPPLTWKLAILFSLAAIASFHWAYRFSPCRFLIVIFLFSLFRLANLSSPRKAFYFGLVIGICLYAPQLGFFWIIFKGAAIALWMVSAIWIALFLLVAQAALKEFGVKYFALLVPFLWMGLEYFRSELYYLRFSWLNVGYVFSEGPEIIKWLGVYGVGFVLMAFLSGVSLVKPRWQNLVVIAALVGVNVITSLFSGGTVIRTIPDKALSVAGVQMEFPPEPSVPFVLDRLIRKFPEAELIVLSEYTFDGPIPEKVKAWCRKNQKYLVAGGKQLLPEEKYYNTAFVIDPNGEIVFRQVKSVPIQFFKDGLPAPEQKLWNSPWGKIGICICYDLSYRRVVDELVRQGAQALIVPTMDVADWGKHQHELHSRVAPTRSAEYGIPIFRVCSSGISQLVNARGKVEASAPFPGDEAMLGGKMDLGEKGKLPLDHWLAPISSIVTGFVVLCLGFASFKNKKRAAA